MVLGSVAAAVACAGAPEMDPSLTTAVGTSVSQIEVTHLDIQRATSHVRILSSLPMIQLSPRCCKCARCARVSVRSSTRRVRFLGHVGRLLAYC